LLLLYFFREPILHEAISPSTINLRGSTRIVLRRVTHFMTVRSREFLSASRTTLLLHNGHSDLPARCILTKHRTQKRCPQSRRIGLKAIVVQIRHA
jgi:hypothetical protein